MALALLYSNILFAQQNNDLDPVTITAGIQGQSQSHTGRNILVIKSDKFNDLPVHSVDELLRYLPGLEVQSRGPLGAQSDFVLRGGTFQQVLVILDGLRLNDPNTGHFSSYIPIAPAEIERIEILKGASSAIYGSDAVGGVIHIITKTFDAKQGAKKAGASMQAAGGEYDLFSLQTGGFYSNGQTSFGLGILSNNTSGQPQRGTKGSVYAHTASFSFSHYFNKNWMVKMRHAVDSRNFSAQNFYTTFISDTAKEKVSSVWSQFAIMHLALKHKTSAQVAFKDLDDEFRFNNVGKTNKSNSNLLQVLLTDEWKAGERTTITSGGQYIKKQIESNDRGHHKINQAAGFVVLNQELIPGFRISPSARMEWNEQSGWEFVPQVNLSYSKRKFQLRGSAGKTTRDADFTERFNNYNAVFVSSGRIGNPDLVAETSFSYEAGADYFLNNELKLSGTYFQRYHKKLIDYVPTPYDKMPRKINLSPTGTYALAKNISEVTTTGFETDIQYAKKIGGSHSVWFTTGFVWTNSKSSDTIPSFYISSHAKWLVNFNVIYSLGRFKLSVNGIYKERKPLTTTAAIAKITSSYFVMNAKIEAELWKNRLGVFAEADNIFDKQYADLLGAQMPGRWLMGGIKISLSK